MGILLALLFILQIIGFMVMTLFYIKISKFNNLEKKQQQLMKEMDQSVLAYLGEIKEENDRLIQQLNKRPEPQPVREPPQPRQQQVVVTDMPEAEIKPKPHPVPFQFALRSYQKTADNDQKEKESQLEPEPISVPKSEPKVLDDRERAKQLFDEGKSISEIARELKKGKTEIELLLKFG